MRFTRPVVAFIVALTLELAVTAHGCTQAAVRALQIEAPKSVALSH